MSVISNRSKFSLFNNNSITDNNNTKDDDENDELSQLARSLIDEYQKDNNNSKVISLEDYQSLLSNDINSLNINTTNNNNNNNNYNNNIINNNNTKKKKKKGNNFYVGNDNNRKLIDHYYKALTKHNKPNSSIRKSNNNNNNVKKTVASYALYSKADNVNPIIDLVSLETKPLVLSSRPVSRAASSRPKSSRVGGRPDPNTNIIKADNNNNNNNNDNNHDDSINNSSRPKSANDGIQCTRSFENSLNTGLNDSLTRDINDNDSINVNSFLNDIYREVNLNKEVSIIDTTTNLASYMTTISVQVSSSPRSLSPMLGDDNTIRLKSNEVNDHKAQQEAIHDDIQQQQSPSKSPTRYSLTPTRGGYQRDQRDIFSPNGIMWTSALGGSMDNYINKLLLTDKLKDENASSTVINIVEIHNKYDQERLSDYLDYDVSNETMENKETVNPRKSTRPIRSSVMSQEGVRLKEKKALLEADMKKRADEVATLVVSSNQRSSMRPSTANNYQSQSKSKDYFLSVPTKELEAEREFLLSLSKQLRHSKMNKQVYNSPRGEAFIDDNIINKISEQLRLYKDSLTWDSSGYKKVIEDIELLRQKENDEFSIIQKRMVDVSGVVFPKVKIINTNDDAKCTKTLATSGSKKTLTKMKFSEKDLLAFPTYPKFNDHNRKPDDRHTSILKFNSSQNESSLITLSLYEDSNPSHIINNQITNNNVDLKDKVATEVEVKTGQDRAVVIKSLNLDKKVIPVLKLELESECMTFSPRASEKQWKKDHSYKIRSHLEKGRSQFDYPSDAMRMISPSYEPPPPFNVGIRNDSYLDLSSSIRPPSSIRPLSAPAIKRR